MAWDLVAQKAVFDLYDDGQLEKAIVKSVGNEFQAHERTIHRCIAGLDLLTAGDEGQPDAEDRLKRLGGTARYLQELRRSYRAHLERVRGPDVNSPLHQHQQDLLGELQRLKETLLRERLNPNLPFGPRFSSLICMRIELSGCSRIIKSGLGFFIDIKNIL